MEKFSPSDFESKWPHTKLASPRGLRPRSRGALIRGKQSFNPTSFESKWQNLWESKGIYQPDLHGAKRPFYNLMMFPYPSAEGLHVGNMYAFTGVDIFGRFKRMQGYDVFEPIGLDGFGIHSENYAIKIGKHPKEQAKISEANFYRQLKNIGNGFAWKNSLETYDPDYYKWTQWIFVQMFKHGLAYRKKSHVNFCPSCKTVLSDEQVIDARPLTSSLASEVGRGKCERCKSEVGKKEMEQWFFKITDYAERLLQNTFRKDFNWTEKVKIGQRNWIGKKEGINITYPVVDEKGNPYKAKPKETILETELMEKTINNIKTSHYGVENRDQNKLVESEKFVSEDLLGQNVTITCFTTRPDTNFGATFIVIGPEHDFVSFLLKSPKLPKSLSEKISDYVKKAKSTSEQERIAASRKKTGVFTGYYCINQLTNYQMPVYISDFVIGTVGTGAVVGVPGHDLRDFEFAKEYKIPILRVVVGRDGDTSEITKPEQVQEEEGTMINSGFLNGKDIKSAISEMFNHLEENGWGKRVTTYKLRDWCISRQRYWGAPIPMINCPKCKWVPDDQLPVLLPDLKDWKPEGTGKGPLAKLKDWVKVKCPQCGGDAERETDVCDTFLDSSWYFLRYPSISKRPATPGLARHGAGSDQRLPWNREITRRWLPVHSYIGGAEHTVLHLLYSRFVWMCFLDWGYLSRSAGDEPYKRFYAHGLIIAEGAKMSKSRGNVIIPDEYIRKYGADTLRAYLMFLGPFDAGGDFRDTGIAGMYRFLSRVWRLVVDYLGNDKAKPKETILETDLMKKTSNYIKTNHYEVENRDRNRLVESEKFVSEDLQRIVHKTIKKITEDLENLRYNTAIAHIMEYINEISNVKAPRPRPARGGQMSNLPGEAIETLLLLLAPFAPHMTEELWQRIQLSGKDTSEVARRDSSDGGGIRKSRFSSIHLEKWPTYDEKYLVESEITIVVQINGKTRDTMKIQNSKSKNQNDIEEIAKESEKVAKHLAGKSIKKVIFVPGKLINFVIL